MMKKTGRHGAILHNAAGKRILPHKNTQYWSLQNSTVQHITYHYTLHTAQWTALRMTGEIAPSASRGVPEPMEITLTVKWLYCVKASGL